MNDYIKGVLVAAIFVLGVSLFGYVLAWLSDEEAVLTNIHFAFGRPDLLVCWAVFLAYPAFALIVVPARTPALERHAEIMRQPPPLPWGIRWLLAALLPSLLPVAIIFALLGDPATAAGKNGAVQGSPLQFLGGMWFVGLLIGALAVHAITQVRDQAKAQVRAATTPPPSPDLTTHGTAKWGDLEDAIEARIVVPMPSDRQPGDGPLPFGPLLGVFRGNWLEQYASSLEDRSELQRNDGHARLAFYRERGTFVMQGDGHLITVAGPGAGKGTCVVIPNLLMCERSVVCIDPKGENASVTAKSRMTELCQTVHVLDPWEITRNEAEKCRASFNPLDVLVEADPRDVISLARTVTEAMAVGRKATGDNAFFDDQALTLLRGLVLHCVTAEPEERRNLVCVRGYLGLGPTGWDELLETMTESGAADGKVAECANQVLGMPEKTLGNVLSTARRFTDFLDDPRIAQVLMRSDFKLSDLNHKPTTLYLCLPPPRMREQAPWLRMILSLTWTSMMNGIRGPETVLFLLDEFASLGRLELAEQAMAEGRGYGIQMWPIVQNLNQLRDSYGDRWQSILGNTRVRQVFGVNDNETAEYFSKESGQQTVQTTSADTEGKISTGSAARRVLTPDEISNLDPYECLLLSTKGGRPISSWMVDYRKDPQLSALAEPNPQYAT